MGSVYLLYFLFYLYTRSLGTYADPAHNLIDFLKIGNFVSSAFLVLFNTLYNNILVNIFPFIVFPFKVAENIYMAGPVINYIDTGGEWLIFAGGGLFGVLLAGLLVTLYKKKRFDELRITGFLLFLMLSELYVIFFCRLATNAFVYNLTEFRYQYIPNAFIVLLALLAVRGLSKRRRVMVYAGMAVLLAVNLYCIGKVVDIYEHQLVDLKRMLSSIRSGIANGSINGQERLYIDEDMPDYLPHLCWNIEMGGRFIKRGNYQWLFSRDEMGYFSEDIQGASWIIDKERFEVAEKTFENISKQGTPISKGKDQQYVNLGNFYKEREEYKKAEKIFRKAIGLNAANDKAYDALGVSYAEQGRYDEAELMLKKAIRANPRNDEAYADLGHLYNEQGRYDEAAPMLEAAVEINPDNHEAYGGLMECYEKLR
ncbi:MAG: tetratricopeptide repeat protein [Thermodesulfobacteriota bacterium]